MRVLFLHTNPYHQEIDNLINDILSNIKIKDIQPFEMSYLDFKFYNFNKLCKLRHFIKKNKIDIVHTYHYIDAYYTMMACKGLKVKFVYSNYFYHDELKGFDRLMYKHVLSHVNTIIFQTNVQKNYITSKYNLVPDKHCKLFHAFATGRLDDYSFNSLRDEYFIDDFRYLIGTIGDFTPEHNVMNVFKMVRKLRRTGRNFTCLVAGDELKEYETFYNDCKYYYLVQGLDNYITYIGKRNDSINVLSQLDAFVYHSDKEAIAIPVIEAMSCGVNVVVNDDEMIKEITFNGKYATLYRSDDIDDFTIKTREVLNNLDDNRMITEIVKEECREIYSIEKHILGLKEIYTNMTK